MEPDPSTPASGRAQSAPLARRTFLIDTARVAAAGWLALQLPFLEACARDGASGEHELAHLTTAEARTLRAVANRIFPSDNASPGAEEIGAVAFVDRALGMSSFAEQVPVVRAGLAALDARARTAGARDGFATLAPTSQLSLLGEIQETPFFVITRALVITGVLADASYGGNRGEAGWALVGYEHRPSHAPPFGWYDSDASPTSRVVARAGSALGFP